MEKFTVKDVLNGNDAGLWLGDEKMSECYGVQAKHKYNKEKVHIPGTYIEDSHVTSVSGSGSLKMYKTNSRMLEIAESIKNGEDVRFTLISKRKNKKGKTERVFITGVSFDESVITDWETGKISQEEIPFTFTDFDVKDSF